MTKVRILVVEDELIVAEDLKMTLITLGYEVVGTSGTGEGAIEIARKERPDIILMDIMLAGELDGITTADRIRAIMPVPVIYITAYADDRLIARAKKTEPFGYIVKPFNEREVRSNIEIALYRHHMEQEIKKRDAILLALGAGLDWFLRLFAERYNAVPSGALKSPGQPAYYPVLESIGTAMDLSRIAIFTYDRGDRARLSFAGEWTAEGAGPINGVPAAKTIDPALFGLAGRIQDLRRGEAIVLAENDITPALRGVFAPLKFTSIAVLEIAVRDEPYGAILFVDSREREWPSEEREAMRMAANLLGSAIGILSEPETGGKNT